MVLRSRKLLHAHPDHSDDSLRSSRAGAPPVFRGGRPERVERAERREGPAHTAHAQRRDPARGREAVRLLLAHPAGVERWTIPVIGNWRITFGRDGADAVAVDLEDYH